MLLAERSANVWNLPGIRDNGEKFRTTPYPQRRPKLRQEPHPYCHGRRIKGVRQLICKTRVTQYGRIENGHRGTVAPG